MATSTDHLKLPAGVTISEGRGELPVVQVKTPCSSAEIYLHGAHVTHFQINGEPPLLFLSQCSQFAAGQPIRGGVPIIFPWFGASDGKGQHGFARKADWMLNAITKDDADRVRLEFQLPECAGVAAFPKFALKFFVTVGESLEMKLETTNLSSSANFEFEDCLHTYFHVGDISAVSVHGLKGATYLDKTDNFARKTEKDDAIWFRSEVDRPYLDTIATVEIHDAKLRRAIFVEKENSASTIVWNPWIARALQLSDLGDEEYRQMVCVESGNVASNRLVLAPGKSSLLKVRLISNPLGM